MKTILVPTDYSDCANNALEYAIALAKTTGASITILNVYHLPAPAGEVPLMLISPAEILNVNKDRLKGLENAVCLACEGKLKVKSVLRQGFAAEEIGIVATEEKADLIVMGIKGSSSAVSTMMGSVATEVTKKVTQPVLVVPAEYSFRPVKKMVFAFDYISEPGEQATLQLKKYAELFSAELQIVNIVGKEEVPTLANAIAGVRMDDSLVGTPHQLFFQEGTDVIDELSNFIKTHDTDWLIMIPHNHVFLYRLFHKSTTKHAAFRINIPLLTIHE
jgi:nucleotide-binding universal stress UspA family protein